MRRGETVIAIPTATAITTAGLLVLVLVLVLVDAEVKGKERKEGKGTAQTTAPGTIQEAPAMHWHAEADKGDEEQEIAHPRPQVRRSSEW